MNGFLILNESNGEGKTALHIACEEGKILNLQISYLKPKNICTFFHSLMFVAGHARVVQLLLSKGALLQRDHQGRTPLHLACENGHVAVINTLMSVHAHLLDQSDKDGVCLNILIILIIVA